MWLPPKLPVVRSCSGFRPSVRRRYVILLTFIYTHGIQIFISFPSSVILFIIRVSCSLIPDPRPTAAVLAARALPAAATVALTPIDLSLAPDQSKYDPTDASLRDAAQMLQNALNARNVEEEERAWSALIDKYESVDAPWRADVIGRAYGNRGNSRSRQGKWEAALGDYNKAIQLCPWSVDPVLNRGVVYENTDRLEAAEADYLSVLKVDASDPSAWNNLGNTYIKMARFEESLQAYNKAVALAPAFSFALANRAECMFQLGQDNLAFKEMRNLLRRYPDFDEVRAALAAALWATGLEAEAEAEFNRVQDPRYRNKKWLYGELSSQVSTTAAAFFRKIYVYLTALK